MEVGTGREYSPEHVEAVHELLAQRNEPDQRLFGLQRVDITLEAQGNGPFLARQGGFEFVIDEPPERAGTDAGPNPLVYIVSGAAGCFLSHLMLLAISEEVFLDSVRVTARGYYDRRAVGGRFTRFVYDLKLESDEPRSAVEALVRKAEKMCYVHNTLALAGVKLETNATLNDQELVRLVGATDHIVTD